MQTKINKNDANPANSPKISVLTIEIRIKSIKNQIKFSYYNKMVSLLLHEYLTFLVLKVPSRGLRAEPLKHAFFNLSHIFLDIV